MTTRKFNSDINVEGRIISNFIKLLPTTNLVPTEAGILEYDGSHLYFTIADSGTRYQLDQQSASIPIASDTVLGGIKIGDGLTIDIDGVVSISPSSGGSELVKYELTGTDGNFLDGIRIGTVITFTLPDGLDTTKSLIVFDGLSFTNDYSISVVEGAPTITFTEAPFSNSFVYYQKGIASSTSGTGVELSTTNFNNNLSAADTTVQKALDTLDNAQFIVKKTGAAELNFGVITQEDSYTKVTIPNTNVKTDSIIMVSVAGTSTADHDPDDYQWDNISAYPTNIVDNTSFDVIGVAPNGTFGKYNINYIII